MLEGQWFPKQAIQFYGGPNAVGTSQSWTFVGSCTSSTSSLDFSSLSSGAIAAGDLAVYCDFARSAGSTVAAVTPSGFDNRVSTVGVVGVSTSMRGMISDKKLTGSEGAITGMDGASYDCKVGLVFRPAIAFTTRTPSTPASEATTGNPAAQTPNPSAETVPTIIVAAMGAEDVTPAFSTASPAFDATVAATAPGLASILVGYKIYNSAPASHTVDMNDEGSVNWLASLYYKVS